MKEQDIFSSTQIIIFNPIMKESIDTRIEYFRYLKKMIRLVNGNRRKYTKAQIKFYKDKLCEGQEKKNIRNSQKAVLKSKFVYLLPFDLTLMLALALQNEDMHKIACILNKIVSDFHLAKKDEQILNVEFCAALGDEKAWEELIHSKKLKGYIEYLEQVKTNTFFIKKKPYAILITATMSSGKSTLINALVGKNISLMQNMACTSKIHTIISKPFEDGITSEHDHDMSIDATREELLSDNENNKSSKITVGTYFNGFLGGERIILYDSPGVNSSENIEHMEITQRMIKARKYRLMLYVLNATQLGTTDEEQHLEMVAKQIGRTKVLFVLNKIDHLISEDDDIPDVIYRQQKFLASKGFDNPIVCPVSARAAYLAKKSQQEILSRIEQREFDDYIYKFEQISLSDYFEKQLKCPHIAFSHDEAQKLYRNSGLAYVENLIKNILTKEERQMAQVYVKYNPYRLETTLRVNGREVSTDSILHKITKGKRLQEWVGNFPEMLREELNTVDFSLEYCGMALDWDDFEDAFEQAQKEGIVKVSDIKYVSGQSDDDINEKIVNAFQDLQEGPIEDFRDAKLLKAFENINNSVFPINVIATMSSGKSTLINALLGKKLMPSKNEACTATITEILDVDSPQFTAVVYNENNEAIQKVSDLTYDMMNNLNENENVHRISAEGDIPFLDSNSTSLMLVDTPGPNNSQNQAHKNTTYKAINNDSNNLILYVLNGTQLSTNDDAALLQYVADQIKKGGKQVRDRFLFVINKMDQFNPEEEDIKKSILSAKRYLASYGIEDPQLFPCSAFTALNIRTYFSDINIDNLTRIEQRKLPLAAQETLSKIDKFVYYDSMHLEQYSTLSPSAQQDLNYRLSQAIENNDTKEQALIHCGIYSIEAAITAYVKKYAKTKKIKDLVETFQEVLESSEILVKAKTKVATDAEAAKECVERADAVRKKIADGKEAEAFKQKIAALDPIPKIEEKVEQLKEKATAKSSKIFRPYGETLTSQEDAKRLVNQFSTFSSDEMAELTAGLESIINEEIVKTGKRLLFEYQEKLSKFDKSTSDAQLDFQTVDLIRGELSTMRKNAESWTSDAFATETVEDIGETTYEERIYYEKVGEEEEEIIVGSHEEKIGTKKVKVGSHKEKTGTRQVYNSEKRWWKIFTPKYVSEDVYVTVNDYKDEDVFETVLDYKTIIRDVFDEKREKIEKFSVSTAAIQQTLIAKMRRTLDEGTEKALEFACEQIEKMKSQFSGLFAKLDEIIAAKYGELERCANDQTEKEATLKENQEILKWLESSIEEINGILEI